MLARSVVVAAISRSSQGTPSSVGDTGPGVPKWVWGLAIGVPVSAALLYILFGPDGGSEKKRKKKGSSTTSTPDEKSPVSKNETAAASTKKSGTPNKVEVEDVPDEDDTNKTPLERAVAAKNKGNKYFRGGRYELAIKCYTEAIDLCPEGNSTDLATFYQNRAAAYHQMEDLSLVISDCDTAINLNNKYVKALDRRAKALRKQAMKVEDFQTQVDNLKQSLEDVTSVCVLEGFQKQEALTLADAVLRELGRAEAGLASKNRDPVLASSHFITQYFSSFSEDPIVKSIEKESEGDVDEIEDKNQDEPGFARAKQSFKNGKFDTIVADCTAEIESNGSQATLARLLRGTFYIFRKQHSLAMDDFDVIINDTNTPPKVMVNALIKRASLHVQRSKDPTRDPDLSFADFAKAAEVDPDNADIYHHRGQIHLLIDSMNKAMVDFNNCVRLNPNFPVAYAQKLFTDYRAAATIGDSVKMTDSLEALEESLDKFPKCVETYALYAQVLNDRQEFDKADDCYKRALLVDPKNGNLLVHRAMVLMQSKGDIQGAVKCIEEALEIDEKCEFAYETLGTIEIQRGNLKRAVELFDKAIPLANTELEMAHLFGLRDAALAQVTVTAKFNVSLGPMGMM